MKRVISNKNIYVLCLPEHEIHPNLLPICVQKSVITSGTLHNLTGHVGIIAQDNKIVFWIKPRVFCNIVVQLKIPEFFKIYHVLLKHTHSIIIIMLWTNTNTAKIILIRNILKHP